MQDKRDTGRSTAFLHAIILVSLKFHTAFGNLFTILNSCQQTLWPATLAGTGTPQLPVTGLRLDPGETVQIPVPLGWSGRLWARTGCTFDGDGIGTCETGDCGGRMECNGIGAQPPVTLFEVSLGNGTTDDFYDVSIVDGYNLPVIVSPTMVNAGQCNATGCIADLNLGCPRELRLEREGGGDVVACKSACEVFGLDQYCCSGELDNPNSCRPSFYSLIFKLKCPRAYSYAFDDGTSTFTCNAIEYDITFCPTINRLEKSNGLSYGDISQGNEYGGEPKVTNSSQKATKVGFSYILIILLCLIIK